MTKKTSEERFVAAVESIAKSLAVMADARKSDQKVMDEMSKAVMPMLRKVAKEATRGRR